MMVNKICLISSKAEQAHKTQTIICYVILRYRLGITRDAHTNTRQHRALFDAGAKQQRQQSS